MSVKMMNNVFEKSLTTGNARLVLLALADTCSDEGVCFPAIKTLAKKANVSEETTRKFLHAFEKIGLVECEERFNPIGRRTSNTYKLNLDKIGDDELTKDVIYSAIPKSKQRTRDGMNQFIPPPYEPVHTIHPLNQFIPSIMNHQKEPSKEPSYGFVADAPKTMNDDLFPNNSKTDSAVIAERSPMGSRPKAAIPTKLAAFQTRANALLGRRPATKWAANEVKAAANWLDTTDEEWELLEGYYANRGQDGYFCRKTMITLLNNWSSEIDKARSKQPVKPKQTCPDEKEDPEGFNAFWASVKPNE